MYEISFQIIKTRVLMSYIFSNYVYLNNVGERKQANLCRESTNRAERAEHWFLSSSRSKPEVLHIAHISTLRPY